jgi:hypothetical protein
MDTSALYAYPVRHGTEAIDAPAARETATELERACAPRGALIGILSGSAIWFGILCLTGVIKL